MLSKIVTIAATVILSACGSKAPWNWRSTVELTSINQFGYDSISLTFEKTHNLGMHLVKGNRIFLHNGTHPVCCQSDTARAGQCNCRGAFLNVSPTNQPTCFFYVAVVFPPSQCPSCHMWDEGTRRPVTEMFEIHRGRLSIRRPARSRNKRKCEIFLVIFCRWTSFYPPPPPPHYLHLPYPPGSVRTLVLRNPEPFFFLWNVDCYQEGVAQRGTPYRKNTPQQLHTRGRKREVLESLVWPSIFQSDQATTQECTRVSKLVEMWRLENKKLRRYFF